MRHVPLSATSEPSVPAAANNAMPNTRQDAPTAAIALLGASKKRTGNGDLDRLLTPNDIDAETLLIRCYSTRSLSLNGSLESILPNTASTSSDIQMLSQLKNQC